jgi:hypothetical protein
MPPADHHAIRDPVTEYGGAVVVQMVCVCEQFGMGYKEGVRTEIKKRNFVSGGYVLANPDRIVGRIEFSIIGGSHHTQLNVMAKTVPYKRFKNLNLIRVEFIRALMLFGQLRIGPNIIGDNITFYIPHPPFVEFCIAHCNAKQGRIKRVDI